MLRYLPLAPSTIAPLPYYPNLRRALKSIGGAVLLAYFEREYASPQDQNGPVLVDCGRTRIDLQLSIKLFGIHLQSVAAVYPAKLARLAAVRGGREFYSRHGELRPYSFVWIGDGHAELRRNEAYLAKLLETCTTGELDAELHLKTRESFATPISARVCRNPENTENAGLMPLGPAAAAEALAARLRGMSVISGDRRKLSSPRNAAAGGAGRARSLSPERRTEIARRAARARWDARNPGKTPDLDRPRPEWE